MSTKCTILYKETKDIKYHFYFNHKDGGYHFECQNQTSFNHFLLRIGKILEQCPLSDAGIYSFSLKKGHNDKVIKNRDCYLLKKLRGELNGKRKTKRTNNNDNAGSAV